jgi:hypothetical protein
MRRISASTTRHRHLAQLAVQCKQISPDTGVVSLDVPLRPRFDRVPKIVIALHQRVARTATVQG